MDKSWKAWERELGKWTGRTRTGPMGSDIPDLPGMFLDIECKYMAKLSLRGKDMAQARRNARNHLWALALKEKQTGRRVVMMDAKQFSFLLELAECEFISRGGWDSESLFIAIQNLTNNSEGD